MIVSSMITVGLSWWQAWICVWLGYGIVAPFIVLNARPGAMYHVTFPVVARTSFGLWGSLWCTFNRGVMAWWVSTYYIHRFAVLNQFPCKASGTGFKQASEEAVCWWCCELCGPVSTISVRLQLFRAYHNYWHLRITANHLPESSGTTTRDFMCFFLFWLISLPAIWFPIHKM